MNADNHAAKFRVNETNQHKLFKSVLRAKLGRDVDDTVVKQWMHTPILSWTTTTLTIHRDYLHLQSVQRRCCCNAAAGPEIDDYYCLLKNTTFIE